ncbi:DMT family transporter [Patescibacteria group bacterium]|nr:DMT family transporter [Patescibacteria group bacterium]
MKGGRFFLWQALLATFLWSISKIVIKFGLLLVSPYALTFAIQLMALVALLIYYFIRKPKLNWNKDSQWITVLVLIGVTGFVIAPLLAVVGLKYVTGTVAGLFAGLNSTLVMILAWLILREKPTILQVVGLAIAFAGASMFLSHELFGGALFGMLLILLAEISYALNTVLTRMLSKQPGDQAFTLALFGVTIGVLLLFPVGLLSGDLPKVFVMPNLSIVMLVGAIFAFGGLIWNVALDQLKAIEAAVLQNTMLVQIAILSMLFLREKIEFQHILGGATVLVGAYLVESKLIESKKHGA